MNSRSNQTDGLVHGVEHALEPFFLQEIGRALQNVAGVRRIVVRVLGVVVGLCRGSGSYGCGTSSGGGSWPPLGKWELLEL